MRTNLYNDYIMVTYLFHHHIVIPYMCYHYKIITFMNNCLNMFNVLHVIEHTAHFVKDKQVTITKQRIYKSRVKKFENVQREYILNLSNCTNCS